MKRFLDYDPFSGITSYHDYDHDSGETKIIYEYDQARLQNTLDVAKSLYNDGTNGYISPEREMKRVALIPVEVQMEWATKKGIDVWNKDHWPAVRRMLNSSDYLYLRTSPGRI